MEEITKQLLDSIKLEMNTENNRYIIKNDIIKPLVEEVFVHIYPYAIGTGIFFLSMIIAIFIILFLNIRICYSS